MCLAVPMKLVEMIDSEYARAELEGVGYEVNISLVDSPAIGDFVIVHAGFAIEKLDEEEAIKRIELFQQMASASEGA